jgi:hypothetical protein
VSPIKKYKYKQNSFLKKIQGGGETGLAEPSHGLESGYVTTSR